MNTTKQITKEPVLLVDCHHGIYIPKLFAEEIIYGNYKVKNLSEITYYLGDLGNPENEEYWESWESLLNNAILIDSRGNEYTLYQNDDLWAIPEGCELPEDF